MHLNFYKIYIIESINPNSFLANGSWLTHSLNTYIEESNKNSSCQLIRIQSREDWINAWREIKKEMRYGISPLIHFIAHGDTKGMSLYKYRKLRWFDILQRLASINKVNKSLFVVMNVCYSSSCKQWINKVFTKPFAFCIFCEGNVSGDKYSLNKPHPRFTPFYQSLIDGKSLESSLSVLHKTILQESENAKNDKWEICIPKRFHDIYGFKIEKWNTLDFGT